MDQIEIILRTTASSGKVTEQLLVKLDTEQTVKTKDRVLQYSGLCIDPDKHQVSYQGKVLPSRKLMNFRHLFISAVSRGEYSPKSRSIRQSGRRNRWM